MDPMEDVLSPQTYAEDTKYDYDSQDCATVGDTASCVTNRCATVGATSSCETTGCEYGAGSVIGTGADPDFAGYWARTGRGAHSILAGLRGRIGRLLPKGA